MLDNSQKRCLIVLACLHRCRCFANDEETPYLQMAICGALHIEVQCSPFSRAEVETLFFFTSKHNVCNIIHKYLLV